MTTTTRPPQRTRSLTGPGLVLLVVVVLLGIRLFSPSIGTTGLPDVVQDFLTLG